jgi:DNA-binding transcriptional regulator YiaG
LVEVLLEIIHELSDSYSMSSAVKERPKKTKSVLRESPAETGAEALARLREELGWSRTQLARVMNCSDRALVNWEQGEPISAIYAARLRELRTIYDELKELMKPREIGCWLTTENEEFNGHSAADLVRRGEAGQLWRSLFYLRTGMPD